MALENDLRTFILADPDVEALVDDRMYPDMIKLGAPLPAIAYQRIATLRRYHLRGQGELTTAEVQLSIWAETRDAADQVAEAIRNRVSGYRGAMGSGESKGIRIVRQFHDSDLGMVPEEERRRVLMDLNIQHLEPQPA